jgi:hypothetical protein
MRLTRALFLVFTLVLVFMVGRAQAACTVTQTCSNGVSSVTCSGNTSCTNSTANHGSVTCDGVTTLCPAYCPGGKVCSTRSDCYSYCAAVVPPGVAYFTLCANRCCSCNY